MDAPQTESLLESQLREKELQLQIAEIERALERVQKDQSPQSIFESDLYELARQRSLLYDDPSFAQYDARISTVTDRENGKFFPFFANEQEHALIRGICRFLATSNEVGVGIVENLISFTIGNGYVYEAINKDGQTGNDGLLAEVNRCIEEFQEFNNWTCDDGENGLEEELVKRDVIDGEFFAWVSCDGEIPKARVPEPDFCTEPVNAHEVEEYFANGRHGYNWSFGIATHPIFTEDTHAYFFQWEQASRNWDVIGKNEMVHSRRNVTRNVKRGMSDFYSPYMNLERAGKLLGNTAEGAAVQATIAYIREHAGGMSGSDIQSFAANNATSSSTVSYAGGVSKTIRNQKFKPGRILDVPNGQKYLSGPLGQSSAPTYIDVMQAVLRTVGVRWAMPEHMISGDASNANYSSTLIAGGPFDRATQRRQGGYKGKFRKIHWQALAYYCRAGRFQQFGIYTFKDLQAALDIKIDAPEVSIENKLEAEQIRETQFRNGILSKKTWASKSSLDYEEELKNGVGANQQQPGGIPGSSGIPGQESGQFPSIQQTTSPAMQESVLLEGGIRLPQHQAKSFGKNGSMNEQHASARTVDEAKRLLESYP